MADDERKTVVEGLIEFNAGQGYVWDRKPLNILARSAEGIVLGGLLGEVNLQWLFVAALWVDGANRGRGIGSSLLKKAEAEAVRLNCVGIFLDTYSFQARPFYERLGYAVFGTLDDCPPGQARFYLAKHLSPLSSK